MDYADKSAPFEPIFLQHVLDLVEKHKEVPFLQPTASETRAAVKLLILETPPMETCEVARPALSRPASTAPSLGSPLPWRLARKATPMPRCCWHRRGASASAALQAGGQRHRCRAAAGRGCKVGPPRGDANRAASHRY
jgi:hypothetical protein